MVGYPSYWALYEGYPTTWTARGKLFLKFLNDLWKYLLSFLAPIYLSNSQSNDFMNFGAYLVSKIGQTKSALWISPYVCRHGKSHFETGSAHVFVPSPQISTNYLSYWRNYGYIITTSSIPPKPPQGIPPTADFKGKFDICVPYGCQINKLGVWANSYQNSEKIIFSKLWLEKLCLIHDVPAKTSDLLDSP